MATGCHEQRLRVFIADDHASIVNAIERTLGEGSQAVGTENNGALATSGIMALRPDIAIMDISIPEMNGIQACEKLMSRGSKTKFLFVSATADPDFRHAAMNSGGHGFTSKTEPSRRSRQRSLQSWKGRAKNVPIVKLKLQGLTQGNQGPIVLAKRNLLSCLTG